MATPLTVGVLRVLLTGNSAQFEQMMRDSSNSAKQWSKDLQSVGRQATQVGATLTKAVTLPLVGAATAAVTAGIRFEDSFAGVRKTVDATEAQLGKLAQGFIGLSKTIPINVNELNRIGEAAGQLGIKTENILGFTEVMAKLGVTTNLSSEQAATALAQMANITQMPQEQFDRLGSTVVALGNRLATSEDRIVDFGLRIAGAGELAGLTEPQILGIGAAMSSVGVEAEAGGTAVQKVLLSMVQAVAEGGDKLAVFARTAGMSSQEFQQAFRVDAAGAFASFVQGLGQQGDQAFRTLGQLDLQDQRLIRSFLSLANAGDLLTDSIRLGSKAWHENIALNDEARKRFDTTLSRLKLLGGHIAAVGIKLFTALKPAIDSAISGFTKLVPMIDRAIDWFGTLPGPVQAAALGIAGIAAAAGPLLLAFGQIAVVAAPLIPMIGTAGLAGAATALVAVLGPLALTGAVLGAMAAFDQLEQSTRDTLDAYQRGEATFGEAMVAAITNGVSRGVNPLGAAWRDVKDAINAATSAWDLFAGRTAQPPPMPEPPKKDIAAAFVPAGIPQNLDAIYRQLDQSQRGVAKSAEELAAEQRAAREALEELTRELDRQVEAMRSAGVWTQEVAAKALAPLIEKLNLAARVSDQALRVALIKLQPELDEIAAGMRASGMDTQFLTDMLDQLRARAGSLPEVVGGNFAFVTRMTEDAKLATFDYATAVQGLLPVSAENIGSLTDAWKTLGLTSTQELQRMADEARRAYARIVEEFGAQSPEAIAAHQRMVEAVNKASRTIPTVWSDEVWPRIHGVLGNIGRGITTTFSDALLGVRGFRDGMIEIWNQIKTAISDILSSILNDFANRFLKGLIGAMTGQRGAFQSAFSGLFGGGGGVPGLGGIPGLGGLFGRGGAAGAGSLASVIGAGPGIAPVAGLPGAGGAAGGAAGIGAGLSGVLGGIGAGGAGLGLGFLGQQLFGGAGAGAAAFGGGSGFATGALIGSIVPGIGTLIGGLIGGLSGVFGGLFGQTKQMKANRSRDQQMADLAERFGLTGTSGTGIGSTFHNIAARLTEATGEHGGGRLFQQLIKAETVEEVNRAIAAVTKTLEEYEARTRSAADAEAQHQQEIGQTTDAYAQQRRALESQLDDVNARLATLGDTADTEMRQAVERQKDAIQRQLQLLEEASADAMQHVSDAATATGDLTIEEARRVRDELAGIFTDREFTIPVNFELPNKPPDFRTAMPLPVAPAVPGFARGTPDLRPLDFGRGTLALLHGLETVVPAGREAEFAARHAATVRPSTVNYLGPVYLNGQPDEAERRRLAAEMAKLIPNVVADGGTVYDEWSRMTRHFSTGRR